RQRLLDALFQKVFGDQRAFARQLYLDWNQARQMQSAGMVMGGHSHRHLALATMSAADQYDDLTTNRRLLEQRLATQTLWPFSYPYGKPGASFTPETMRLVAEAGFCCGFSTQVGTNAAGADCFTIARIDT